MPKINITIESSSFGLIQKEKNLKKLAELDNSTLDKLTELLSNKVAIDKFNANYKLLKSFI